MTMTRYIDGDVCIEKIKSMPVTYDSETVQRCIEVVSNAPTVDVSTVDTKPHWIPCSERLPEIKGHYVSETCLVCLDNGAIGFSELQENIFGQVGWSCEREDDYHEPLGDVAAWMPLPKPYPYEGDKE